MSKQKFDINEALLSHINALSREIKEKDRQIDTLKSRVSALCNRLDERKDKIETLELLKRPSGEDISVVVLLIIVLTFIAVAIFILK